MNTPDPRDAEIAALVAENEALHEKLSRKDEACNNTINAALMMPDPVREQLVSRAAVDDGVPQGFIDYVQANYNGVVDIHRPEWHAKRLWRAAMRHVSPTAAGAVDRDERPFMYAIMGPGGEVHFDEMCVSGTPSELSETVFYLNEEQKAGDYSVVPVYTRPTANGAAALSDETVEMWIGGIGGGIWNDGKLTLKRDELAAVIRGIAALAVNRATANGAAGAP